MDIDNLLAAILVWYADFQLAVEATRTPQRRVDCIAAIGRADDHDIVATLHSIQQSQKLGDDSTLDLTRYILALWCDRV